MNFDDSDKPILIISVDNLLSTAIKAARENYNQNHGYYPDTMTIGQRLKAELENEYINHSMAEKDLQMRIIYDNNEFGFALENKSVKDVMQ